MDISGMTSAYTDYITSQAGNATTNKLNNQLKTDYSNATDDELMSACKQFEAYFLEQVLKGMEKTIPKSEDSDTSTSSLVDYFKDSMMQDVAAESTKTNSLGIAQMMYEQMKRNYEI